MLKFISETNLTSWLNELSQAFTVFTPQNMGRGIIWQEHKTDSKADFSVQPLESAKHVIFPRSQELLRFRYEKQENGTKDLKIEEAVNNKKQIIFGARPCDARGFFTFDPVYNGKIKDTPYLEVRNNTLIIGLSCNDNNETCFCSWIGSNPVDENGSDLILTPVSGGYTLKLITERGKELFNASLLQEASTEQNTETDSFKQASLDNLKPIPDLNNAPEKILARFDDMDFWQSQSYKCLSCGACTYLCPTCYCFNITDENKGSAGARLRSWDACMSANFTLEGSGHNPRNTRFHRMKNRVGHKFSYYPTLHKHFACCGCGRCIKSCPVAVDIREIVLAAINHQSVDKGVEKHG
ncbi:4Fe-4S dicluster domain-containing protein [Desulfovibrio litoralis]|uniref:4Fe-4S dicluster domain-containing protein n=1 Tax=Desulfovibrio litoralis DSM 11393 TaxID=1121455 RepID=A0A1M7T8Q6_9BACT|nr:4Fe-4S dicluster domain-containing protein [Desulfovibrio litoralis]SHN67099.1 4Fe-4S dicluster domain-containing protein [Desulfovibrio litoralis DSM 11393]